MFYRQKRQMQWKRKRNTEKEMLDGIESDMKKAGISFEDAGDRVKWMLRIMVTDLK